MILEGKTALVTGGGHGIGRGLCLALAKEGAKVVINYSRDDDAASWTKSLIEQDDGTAVLVKADVGYTDQCQELVEKSNQAFGHIDILISNAGIGQQSKIVDCPDEEWDRVMNVNLKATFVLARGLMPGMIDREFGRIVTISSNRAATGTAGASFVPYATSKGALETLTKGIAVEGAPWITANAISPGGTSRQIASERGEEWPPPPAMDDKFFLGRRVLLNRIGTPEDVAGAMLFLVSDSGCFVTGQNLHVSGGVVM